MCLLSTADAIIEWEALGAREREKGGKGEGEGRERGEKGREWLKEWRERGDKRREIDGARKEKDTPVSPLL